MNKDLKLYKVTLKGMQYSTTGVVYGVSYVVEEDSHKAYLKVREFLDKGDLGFSKDRELEKVELIADTYEYTDVDNLLFI